MNQSAPVTIDDASWPITERTSTVLRNRLQPLLSSLRSVVAGSALTDPASALRVPFDSSESHQVRTLLRRIRVRPREVVVVGIGGSSLGAAAVWEAVSGLPAWGTTKTRLTFLETPEENALTSVLERVATYQKADDIRVVIISKSGKTTETIVNAAILADTMRRRWPKRQDLFSVVTDVGSPLAQLASSEQWNVFPTPSAVPGRYSVFSAVGLVPLTLAGVSVEPLLDGARTMIQASLADGPENPAVRSAVRIFFQATRGKRTIHDTFVFRPQLFALGQWYRQLAGESLGKTKPRGRGQTRVGFTPTVSIGSNDLHSVAQLTLAGPRDKMTTFINAPGSGHPIPSTTTALLVPGVGDRTTADVRNAILRGTQETYRARRLPFANVTLSGLSAEACGGFMGWKMVETVLLAQLFGVNPFDQPDVEEYKQATRKLLEKP